MGGDQIRGTIQNDILKEYAARGTYIYPPAPSMRLVTDVFAYAAEEIPGWNTISISGYHIREAGADAVQEVAFTLANGATSGNAGYSAGTTYTMTWELERTLADELQIALSLDDNDDNGNDFMGFYSGNNGTAANHPQLVITYQP